MLLEPLVREQLQYDPAEAQFFLCGPADYMRMILLTLTFMGFSPAQLHKENFVVNTGAKLERAGHPDDATLKHVTLQIGGNSRQIDIPGNRDILSSALELGIALPYSCKGGVCGSCTAKCISGKVWMAVNEVLTDRELEQGLVLTCVGYPVSDQVTIEW